MKPAQKRAATQFFRVGFQVSERRACHLAGVARSSYSYRSVATDQPALRLRLRDLAAARVRYGYRRLHILLQREGWQVNHKRVYGLYREEGLGIRANAGESGLARRESSHCQHNVLRSGGAWIS